MERFLIASLSGIVVLTFLYLRKIGAGSGASRWAAAWLALWIAGLLLSFEALPLQIAGHAVGGCFMPLILAGACGFVGRPFPRWVAGAVLASIAAQAALRAGGLEAVALGLGAGGELLLGLGAAWLLFRARDAGATLAGRLLGPALLALTLLNLLDSVTRIVAEPSLLLVTGWIVLGLTISLIQIMAIVDRVLAREEGLRRESERLAVRVEAAADRRVRELGLLRRLAAAGTAHGDTQSLVRAFLDAAREDLELDLGGVWLLGDEPGRLACAGHFGLPEPVPADFLSIPTDAPLPVRVLSTREPWYLDDIARRANLGSERIRALGVRSGAVLPLWHAGRDVGMLTVGRRAPDGFDQEDRRLLAAVAEELALAVEHVRGIEQRRRQAEELASERGTLRAVLESAPVGVFLVDSAWRNTVMNRLGAQHLGLGDPTEWLGRTGFDGLRAYLPFVREPEALVAMIRRVGADPGAVVEGFEFTLERPEERTLNVFSSPVLTETGARAGRVFVTRDVTQERALEDQLRQSQKMETLGTLAGGVAHDFNNQLTAILGNTRLALDEVPAEAPLREKLLDLERAAEHCAQLTRGLLAFARRTPVRAQAIDVARVVGEVASLLRATLPQAIALRVECDEALRAGLGDPTQLQQILLNLCINARDAVGERGEIAIEARNRMLGAAECSGRPGARPGRFIELAVRDDGVGMDPRVFGRIFDPFFTTKPVGAGTGLGLAIVYGLVRANQGWIDVASEPGRGSTFRIWLPATDESAPAEISAAPGPRAGIERILLAEDEAVVRRVARMALEREGYRVLEACDGAEAVELLRAGEQVDLAVLDLSMPRLGGLAALAELRKLAPDLPAILTSGHFTEAGTAPDVEFLPKPYRPDALAERVRGVLDAGKPR